MFSNKAFRDELAAINDTATLHALFADWESDGS
jgi:hypothetical protein